MMGRMALPEHPARVRVTLADGTVGWLADPPEAPIGSAQRWQLVDTRADAGVWPWPRASNWSGPPGSRGAASTRPPSG